MSRGQLTLATTPIGHLGDISIRLKDTLRSADELWCEDTRVSRKLLNHLDIHKPLYSFHDHSAEAALKRIQEAWDQGKHLVYLSDAGMPGISDPGVILVKTAWAQEVALDLLPGPSAFLCALVLSGFPLHRFVFMGFFPRKQKERQEVLAELVTYSMTAAFYESPRRLEGTLQFFAAHHGDLPLFVARELTKIHQSLYHGTASALLAQPLVYKGECVLVLPPVPAEAKTMDPVSLYETLQVQGVSPREARKLVMRQTGLSRRTLNELLRK
jgi:16S rRNA (cytidine1402-2'-O)-methyltransferase